MTDKMANDNGERERLVETLRDNKADDYFGNDAPQNVMAGWAEWMRQAAALLEADAAELARLQKLVDDLNSEIDRRNYYGSV